MLVEAPIAVTKEAPEPAAEDFLKFLWSNAGQELWAKSGYRPVNWRLVDQEKFFPRRAFRISRFGGWAKVNEEFFDEETGSVAKIEEEFEVPTGG
jgi:ABC-type sulfate transport system substrate-binding protein